MIFHELQTKYPNLSPQISELQQFSYAKFNPYMIDNFEELVIMLLVEIIQDTKSQ